MSKMGYETVFYLENFECAGDEVLVESSPPASPADMAARLAAPAQGAGGGAGGGGGGGGSSPDQVRDLIVIPEIPTSLHLQHAMHQVTNAVVEVNGVDVNGDSSGHSSPATDAVSYITVAGEGGAGVNYHVQYVEPQEMYTQPHGAHMETLRTYPVYGVATVGAEGAAQGAGGGAGSVAGGADTEAGGGGAWGAGGVYAAYDVVVAADEAEAPASPATPAAPHQPPRMPPATVQWLLDNYETAEGVSLPRSTLYAHYLRHCAAHRLEPVNAASFGKLIRSVFLGLRTRRLGTRGNSKYHYYGIRAKPSAADSPQPPDEDKTDVMSQEGREREGSESGVAVGVAATAAHRQYLGAVSAPEPPELQLLDLPDDVPRAALHGLREHHRAHGSEFLEAVAALDTGAVERARRAFWRRPPAGLCRRVLLRLAGRREVAAWLRAAELALHQRAVELLLPDVLRPIPAHLTQAIRNFAKTLEAALSAGSSGAPPLAARAQAFAATALAAALRRYTSLNHLAQAARAVLHNQHQIQQMLADLNRVDFRVVREQAAWACSCGSTVTAHRLEADFKATLGRGASLEQWATWLETCVRGALAPHERRPDYSSRARRFLLDWSFYSSLVIRELTLRSAASFGSFHLIRLLYDEYVAYLIERRVALHEKCPPIAVMHRAQELEEDAEGVEGVECAEGEEIAPDADDDDPDWEWDDDEEDSLVLHKKPKMQ